MNPWPSPLTSRMAWLLLNECNKSKNISLKNHLYPVFEQVYTAPLSSSYYNVKIQLAKWRKLNSSLQQAILYKECQNLEPALTAQSREEKKRQRRKNKQNKTSKSITSDVSLVTQPLITLPLNNTASRRKFVTLGFSHGGKIVPHRGEMPPTKSLDEVEGLISLSLILWEEIRWRGRPESCVSTSMTEALVRVGRKMRLGKL